MELQLWQENFRVTEIGSSKSTDTGMIQAVVQADLKFQKLK